MNIYNLKQATTGMTLERPILLKGNDGPVPITSITEVADAVYLYTSDEKQLTLFDLWELESDKRLVGVLNGNEVVVFGYRVSGDEIILG